MVSVQPIRRVTTSVDSFFMRVSTSFTNVSQRVTTSLTNVSEGVSRRIRANFYPRSSVFDEKDIEEYMALTYLSRDEILRAYTHFCSMEPDYSNGEKNPFLPSSEVMKMPEFKVNPFREQMLKAITLDRDGLTFEDYLEMMSAFSEQAPIELKAEYAFRIYDFDFDDMLSIEDLVNVLKHLNNNSEEIKEEDMRNIAVKAMLDGDVDGDGLLAFSEFFHLIKRLEDFKRSFTISI